MLIDGLYRNCVCYVVVEVRDEENDAYFIEPVGTAFFVEQLMGIAGRVFYVVTARHVIEKAHKNPRVRRIFLRVNSLGGGCSDIPTEYSDWTFHESTDIAVCRVHKAGSDLAFYAIGNWQVVSADIPGYDIFAVGLFYKLPGIKTVDAVVRFGKIAHERTVVNIEGLNGDGTQQVDAYLVEMRSWGGESGSPVFVHGEYRLVQRNTERREEHFDRLEPLKLEASWARPSLLGILHGHFSIELPVRSGSPEMEVDFNSGIAVVIPSQYIIETLNYKHLAEEREEIKRKFETEVLKRSIPKPDSTQ